MDRVAQLSKRDDSQTEQAEDAADDIDDAEDGEGDSAEPVPLTSEDEEREHSEDDEAEREWEEISKEIEMNLETFSKEWGRESDSMMQTAFGRWNYFERIKEYPGICNSYSIHSKFNFSSCISASEFQIKRKNNLPRNLFCTRSIKHLGCWISLEIYPVCK